MSAHAPGPWIQKIDENNPDHRLVLAAGEHAGLDVASVRPWMTHGEANARLIAAAPELLAALEARESACADRGDHHRPLPTQHDARRLARAAIAKARGK